MKLIQLIVLFLTIGWNYACVAQDNCLYIKRKNKGKDESFCFINKTGKIIVPYKTYSFSYNETICTIGFVFLQGKGIYAINNRGIRLYKVYYFDNGPDYLEDGLFRMIGENGKIGFADSVGIIRIQPKYDFAEPFENGKAHVCIGGHLAKADDDGEHSIWVGGKWGAINKKGKVIVPIQYKNGDYLKK